MIKSELGLDDDLTAEELAIRMRGVKMIEYYAACDRVLADGTKVFQSRLTGPFEHAEAARIAAKTARLPADAVTGVYIGEMHFFR
jgi:hypothetical protein